MPVQQSGSITPGHLAIWATDGAIQDGGPIRSLRTVLGRLPSANFNSIVDQAIQISNFITAFQLTGIVICNPSMSLATAVGGFYPTIAKGGTAIVAAGQVYSTLTGNTSLLSATVAATPLATRYSSVNMDSIDGFLTLYLSLTTPQGVPCTADIYVLGNDLTV